MNSEIHGFLLKEHFPSLCSTAPSLTIPRAEVWVLQGASFSAALLWPPSPSQVAAEKVSSKSASFAPWWKFGILQEVIFGCQTASFFPNNSPVSGGIHDLLKARMVFLRFNPPYHCLKFLVLLLGMCAGGSPGVSKKDVRV